MMDYSEITNSSTVVARVARVAHNTLQAWYKRGVLAGHRIEGGGSPGKRLKWSFFSLMEVSVANALIAAGVSELPVAFAAAAEFAHVADGPRLPGLPFDNKKGQTVLVASNGLAKVIQWEPGVDPIPLFWSDLGRPESWIMVNVEAVFHRVMSELGHDPAAIMREAYGS